MDAIIKKPDQEWGGNGKRKELEDSKEKEEKCEPEQNNLANMRIWTTDLQLTKLPLYPWAISAGAVFLVHNIKLDVGKVRINLGGGER